MDFELISGVGAVAIIVAVVQVVKGFGFPSRFAGLLAVGFGVVLSLGHAYLSDVEWFRALIIGLAVGLSAAGFWSAGKHTLSG